ncbi:hypothetical protein K505DRAFT_362268 [Melanomma pulvis-pyrius CBS 109.77]|uniref:Uncharacterized protein n=1 Tax=Melanomma pulvis-pyrius CBS 109.77 TaxID=1314802 RepID=A0A6A6XA21_9PLEO|nr:hypothetical protein K505DRAFT_362268 [Melanomma pulvis-pyrius CBS 109.77]
MAHTTILQDIFNVLNKALHDISSPQNHVLDVIIGIGIGLLLLPICAQMIAMLHYILNRHNVVYLKLANLSFALYGVFVDAATLIVVGTFVILVIQLSVGSVWVFQCDRVVIIQNTLGVAVIHISLKHIVKWLAIWFGVSIVFRELRMSMA